MTPAVPYLYYIIRMCMELACRTDDRLIEDEPKGLTTAIVHRKILHGDWSIGLDGL